MNYKTVKILLSVITIAVAACVITIIVLLIFKSKQVDDTYMLHGVGTVSDIDFDKKEITLTNIEYGKGKKLDRLILIVDDVNLYNADEERINLDNIPKAQKLKFYYFDTEECLLRENSKINPNSIYNLSEKTSE